jgi:hypothetical protein
VPVLYIGRTVPKRSSDSVKCLAFNCSTFILPVHAVAQWLRHCATNRKVAGSIPDGITGFFH